MAMDKLGLKSTLHLVSIDDHVRQLLATKVAVTSAARPHDSTDPHLIVQFKAGTRVRVADIDIRLTASESADLRV